MELERYESGHFLAGVLLDGLGFHGDDQVEYVATEAGIHSLCFPQGSGRARLYLSYGDERKARSSMALYRAVAYLDAFSMACWPASTDFAGAEVIGPAKAYRSIDTWCARPFAEGVVLVGDAAGHNDPIIGQGLSITMADVRGVTDALLAGDDWTDSGLFEPYAVERLERLHRLRATARGLRRSPPAVRGGPATPSPGGATRRARLVPHARRRRGRPWDVPDEVFLPENIERLRTPPPA